MTLWNPLNLFSSSQRRVAGDPPAASFDPSRIGDPVDPSYDRPAVGFGETGHGASGIGESRRHPVGFAPWDEETAQRYVTEFSFKRHHDMPRASVTPDRPELGSQESWQTPEPVAVKGSVGVGGSDATADEPPTVETVEQDAKVPFYKREIGFHRKRATVEQPLEEVAVGTDNSTQGADSSELAEDLDASVAGESDHVALESAAEVVAEQQVDVEVEHVVDESEPAAAEAVAEVDLPAEAEEPTVDGDGVIETGGGAKVPFYKREISFRRNKGASSEDTSDAFATDAPDDVADVIAHDDMTVEGVAEAAVAAEVVGASEEASEPSDEPSVDAGFDAHGGSEVDSTHVEHAEIFGDSADDARDVEADSVVDLEPVNVESPDDVAEFVPVVSPDEMPESGAQSDLDDLFIEDTPAPEDTLAPRGRRSSGKDKSSEKAPKRKAARGGPKGRRVVGLKIGASQIAAAVVVEADGKHELVDLARRPLAPGIVVDGEIKDLDALSNALKAFFAEENLPKKDVRIGLASNRIGVRTFDIVGIDDEARFDNAVRFKAHEVLPVVAHESVLDYRVLEERPNEAGEPTRRVLLVVAPSDQVEPYAEVARRVGIKLSGIDLEALGLLRAFVDPKPFAVRAVDDTATVVVSIGHESSTLLVAGGGACEFTRVFDWGGGALIEAIASTLEVHPAEAATILKHLSLSGPGRQLDGFDEASRTKALDAVRLRLTPFARELVSSLQFYQTQEESLGIGGIVITGGTSHLEGLGETLHQMIGVNVSVGDPLARVLTVGDFDPAIEATIGSMAVPIGLAIDDITMRGVNLLPKDVVQSRSTRSTMIAIGAPLAAVVPLVAVGVLYMGAHGKAVDRQAELDAVQAEIATVPKPTGPEIDASIVGDEATRATAVASVLGGRIAWDAVFADMARILPANVWLKGLSVNKPESAVLADGTANAAALPPGQGQPAPTAVSIDGFTYSQTDVARLLARLATLPSLRRVTLTSSGRETIGKKDVIHFVIVADLNQTGGVS